MKELSRLLAKCGHTIEYLNLVSCRGLPKPVKRLHSNKEAVAALRADIESGIYKADNEADSDD